MNNKYKWERIQSLEEFSLLPVGSLACIRVLDRQIFYLFLEPTSGKEEPFSRWCLVYSDVEFVTRWCLASRNDFKIEHVRWYKAVSL